MHLAKSASSVLLQHSGEARNGAIYDTVPGVLLGVGRSSSLPAISSSRTRPLSTEPFAFFLSCIIFTSSCVPVFCCTLRALVEEERQERGPARHGPGRRQPENSSSPLAGRTHASTARSATNVATRYLHHQLRPGVLLHPPDLQAAMPRVAADSLQNPPSSSTRHTHASTTRSSLSAKRTPAPPGRRPSPPPPTRSGVGRTVPPRSS